MTSRCYGAAGLGWAGLFSELIRVFPACGCTSHGPPGCTVAHWDSSVRTDSPTGDSGPLQEQRFFWCLPGLSRIPPRRSPSTLELSVSTTLSLHCQHQSLAAQSDNLGSHQSSLRLLHSPQTFSAQRKPGHWVYSQGFPPPCPLGLKAGTPHFLSPPPAHPSREQDGWLVPLKPTSELQPHPSLSCPHSPTPSAPRGFWRQHCCRFVQFGAENFSELEVKRWVKADLLFRMEGWQYLKSHSGPSSHLADHGRS